MKNILIIILTITAMLTFAWNTELTTSKTHYSSGENVWMKLHDRPAFEKDWIGIYNKDDSNEWKNVVKWVWEKDTSPTEVDSGDWYKFTNLKDGEYEARFFLKNSFNLDYKTSFTVGRELSPISNMSLSQKSYTSDSTISINLSNNLSENQDWVGIYAIGSSNDWDNVIAWNWVHGGDNILSNKLKDMAGGKYEARLFHNNSYKVENSVEFSVNDVQGESSDQCTIGDNHLNVIVKTNNQKGVSLLIKRNGKELIDAESLLFTAKVESSDKSTRTLSSITGWDNVRINCAENNMQIKFNSDEFVATSNISVDNGKSQWDYSIQNKTNNKSILNVNAPYLYFKKLNGKDNLFYPSKLGMVSEKPTEQVKPFKIEGDRYDALTYPTGVDMSMQYMAYYGSDFGLYIGYHDPKASIKTYHVNGNNENLKFYIETPASDATIYGNNFEMSGHVELDVFNGDWYDAAQIYKQWVFKNANYRPNMDGKRIKRQEKLSKIGIWVYTGGDNGGGDAKSAIDAFQDITHVGIVWNQWGEFGSEANWDKGYPNYFPVKNGAKESMDLYKGKYGDRVSFIPYINGRLFDANLPNFQEFASKNAIKTNKAGEDDKYSIQNFGLDFAVMNPKSTDWQNIIAKVGGRAINEMAVDGLYLDQIARSSVEMCFDSDNCHGTIGGGAQWREGYAQLLDKVNSKTNNSFVMVEGNSDFVIDKVDSYLVQLAYRENVVPAFQVVYSGKVNFNSAEHGTADYNKPSFYAKFAHAFVNGIVPGQFAAYFGIQNNNNAPEARSFIHNLSKLRTLHRNYLALGFMQRAPKILIKEGPNTIYSEDWNKDDVIQPVEIQSIQASAYCTKDNKNLGLFFANASINKTIKFNFTVPDNNCGGGIDKSVDVTLNGKEVVAYKVKDGEIMKL